MPFVELAEDTQVQSSARLHYAEAGRFCPAFWSSSRPFHWTWHLPTVEAFDLPLQTYYWEENCDKQPCLCLEKVGEFSSGSTNKITLSHSKEKYKTIS